MPASGREDAAEDDAAAAPGVAPQPTLALVPATPAATPHSAHNVERVSIEPAPPTTRVVLDLDGSVEPNVSLLANMRLVLDLPGTDSATLPRLIGSDDALVERIRIGQHGPPDVASRVVIDLRRRADFAVRSHGTQVVIVLSPADGNGAAPTSDAQPSSYVLLGAEAPSRGAAPTAPAAATSENGAPNEPLTPPGATPAVVTLERETTADAATPPSPDEVPALARPTLSQSLDADTPDDPIVEVVREPIRDAGLEPAPAPPLRPAPATPVAIVADTGASQNDSPPGPTTLAVKQRISIDFVETDVRTVIELVASAGGYHVLFTPDVEGTITITLIDRPWETVLATVLRANRLREVRHDDVILVSPESPPQTPDGELE